MSAWMLGDKHLATLAKYAVEHKITGMGLRDTAEKLWRANAEGYRDRYGDEESSSIELDRGLPHFKSEAAVERAVLKRALKQPMVMYKAAHCFDYQACEAEATWPTSEAKWITDAIAKHARESAGYTEEQAIVSKEWSDSNGWPLVGRYRSVRERLRARKD